MADQVGSGTVQSESSGRQAQGTAALGPSGVSGASSAQESFHGRPVSWVSIGIIIAGFIIGGVGLVAGPTWWLVWAGGAVVAVGGILSLATGVVNDWY
jgi:hypothetical protein